MSLALAVPYSAESHKRATLDDLFERAFADASARYTHSGRGTDAPAVQ